MKVEILTNAEFVRLIELIAIQNTATQVDREESAELATLLVKLLERD